MRSDEDLLRDFYEGSPGALDELFDRHVRGLAGFLLRCVGDVAVARRLVDEVLAAVYLTKGHPENHFDTARGPAAGFLYAQAGELAFRWLRGLLG
jgi:hypothetical protein